jgi:ActR/RegA family two-component response regulator
VAIDLADNTDAGFYAAGSEYSVILVPDETVDGLAVVRVLAQFSIARPNSLIAAVETKVDAVDDFIDTEVAAIKAKTDNLPADPADASDIAAAFTTVNTKLDTIDDFLDTEVAAIKAKTDNLPADPADASDIAAAFTTVNTKLDTIDDFLDTEVAAIKAKTDNLPSDPADASEVAAILTKVTNIETLAGTTGVVVAGASKTGYALSAAGLDSISTTAPSGVASNFREMIVQTWRRWFKKTELDTAGTLKTFADNGTTVITTQTVTETSTVQTVGSAT